MQLMMVVAKPEPFPLGCRDSLNFGTAQVTQLAHSSFACGASGHATGEHELSISFLLEINS